MLDSIPRMDDGDRRVRRTRAHLREATLRLLDQDTGRLTMAAVAEAADVNRSTVHQHYGDVDELICDALGDRLRGIAQELTGCPFAADRDRAPRQLVTLFTALGATEPLLVRLGPSGRARIERELSARLAEVLAERFRAGQRPPGFDRVRPELHAGYVAAGLVAIARTAGTSGRLAGQAWQLIRGHGTRS